MLKLHAVARISAFLVVCAAAAGAAAQDNYPNKPIRMIVGLSPGGMADQAARLLGPGLSKELGRQIVVENRVGATGAIAARMVADSAPDGYTLMMVLDGTLVLPAALNPNIPFDAVKDFAPIVKLIESPMTVVAHPSLAANNLAELLELTRSPGGDKKYFYGSAGNGSSGHLLGEYLKQLTGLQITHVSYKGAADAARDTVGGQIPLLIASVGTSLPFVKSGRLKGLAVTSAKRFPALPDMPTAAESGLPALKNFNVPAWAGIVAPAGTPDSIIRRVYEATAKVLGDGDLIEKYAGVGAVVSVAGPAQFGRQIASELEQWRKVVRQANLRSE